MKTKFLLLFSILFYLGSNAQIGFQENIIIDNADGANGASDVYSEDIDGDGDMDLITASFFDNKIAWYENLDGQGNFGPQNIISTQAIGANSIFAADLDGDGDVDVLSTSNIDDKVVWYRNLDGAGTFGANINFPLGNYTISYPISIYAADFDGDLDIDVVAVSRDKISTFINLDGMGNFGPQEYTPNDNSFSNSFGDINNDGYLDILVTGFSRTEWLLNNGSGYFGASILIDDNFDIGTSLVSGDLDGDGDLDVIANYYSNSVVWYENFNGIYGPQNTITNSVEEISSVYTTDIDGDGDLDVLSASSADNKIAWYENTDGQGSFGNQQIISTLAEGANTVIAVDIDEDGNIDIISSSNIDDKIAWYKNTNGLGNFGPQQIVTISQGANGAKSAFSADLDGDGNSDVISASFNDDKISWFKNIDGEGNFGTRQIITDDADGAVSVHAADLDGDGDNDIICSSSNDTTIAWFENLNGLGTFGPKQILSSTIGGDSVTAVDLDGDGDLDILSAFSDISWFENLNGNGNYSAQNIITSFNSGYFVDPADIDGDGDLDLFYSTLTDNKVGWLENTNGLGVFENHEISNIEYPMAVKSSDVDNDGDLDVLVANETFVGWFINLDGFGTFSPQVQYVGVVGSYSNTIALNSYDLDDDSDWDVVVGDANNLYWYENLNGNFNWDSPQVISNQISGVNSIYLIDINIDDRVDILTASEFDDKIAWFENTGPLNIQENVLENISIYPNPTTGLFNIKSKDLILNITIYNQLGQLVLEESKAEGINYFNIENLNAGIYFVKLKTNNSEVVVKKLIKK